MTQQYLQQQAPSVKLFIRDGDVVGFDGKGGGLYGGLSKTIPYIDVIEVSPESQAQIAKHPREDGTVYADTKVIVPARYHVTLGIPAVDGKLNDAIMNLLDASHVPSCFYTVTSYFSRCWNMMVVSSRHRDTPDMQGLRIQDVVFEECLEYSQEGRSLTNVDDPAESDNQNQSVQLIMDDNQGGSDE